jgi:hypothetical protein
MATVTHVGTPKLITGPSSMSQGGLRLVKARDDSDSRHAMSRANASVPCLVLKSAMGDKNIVNDTVLIDLFQSLRTGERIEFSHSVHRDEFGNAPTGHPYRLRIRVAAASHYVDHVKARIATAFESAFPGFHFVTGGAIQPTGQSHIAQFALSGIIASPKPLPARVAPNWSVNPALSGMMDSGQRQERQSLPFPEDLPNWAFSAPFAMPLSLPASTEIVIRIHGFSLDVEACEMLHRTLFRIESGNFAVFHPTSPIAEYSIANQLQDPTINLVRHWLQHPVGFAVDCVVKSSEPLSDAAQSRIIGDVFGKRPYHRVLSAHSTESFALAAPEFSWAIFNGQGLPALMPAQSVLSQISVPRHYAAPTVTPPTNGAFLGSTVCARRSSNVSLPFASRSRHVAVLGATGAGKSSLLTQMMAADIADPDRKCGIGLIDPHGSLYQRVLELIPPQRADDVILVDTSDPYSTACVNPLEGMKDDPVYANFVVAELMSLIDLLLEGKDTSGPMTKSNLRNLLLLTTGTPGRHSCILDAVRVLEDVDYAEYLLSKCQDRNVKDYWDKFKKTTGTEQGYGAWAPYMMARLTPFVANPIMKRLINRPDSSIDFVKAMQDRKIVLFNLNKGLLNDSECQILGSLILSKFFAAALSRSSLPEAQRIPFHLYVDEFASFANDATPRLFSEARKFGLCLNIAFQSLSQLENRWGRSNVAHAVLANCATKFIMRLGPADTSTLEPFFQPNFDAAAMTSLPDFHAVACMNDNNRFIPPFVLKVHLASPDPEKHMSAVQLEGISRKRYCVPIEQANRELSRTFDLDLASLGSSQMYATLELQPLVRSSYASASSQSGLLSQATSYLASKARVPV